MIAWLDCWFPLVVCCLWVVVVPFVVPCCIYLCLWVLPACVIFNRSCIFLVAHSCEVLFFLWMQANVQSHQ